MVRERAMLSQAEAVEAVAGRRLCSLDGPIHPFGEVTDLGVEAGFHHIAHGFDPGLARFGDLAVDPHVTSHAGDAPLADQHLPLLALEEVLVELQGFFSFSNT
jgi:hypothetical protein